MTRSPDEDALWTLDPDAFVDARDELVRQLRARGERDEAARVKALRKPARDAWAVNRLAKENPAAVQAIVAVGERLRAAVQGGDAAELRALSAERAQVVQAGLEAAVRLTGPLTPAVTEAVRATLGAALADPGAATQVIEGRLTTGLVYAGLGVAPGSAPPATPFAGRAGKQPTDQPAESSVTPRRPASVSRLERPDGARLRAAEQALRDAEDEVTAIQLARAEAQEQVDELAESLEEAKQLLAEAQLEARRASRARDAAAAALERLRRRDS